LKKDEKVTQAAALKYSSDNNAPQVVALGKGSVGEKIIEAANQSGVPIIIIRNLLNH
jgi:flagellar biosynthesis protein